MDEKCATRRSVRISTGDTKMEEPHRMRLLAPLALLAPWLISGPAKAQDAWPAHPIHMVVPYPPGGSSDILGRLVADRLVKALGGNASIIVDNKPGATTQIGTEFVAKAAPDGYTLLFGAASSFTLLPNIRKLGYSVDSFDFIGGVAEYLAVIAVRESLPVKNLAQFVEHAKKNPGKLSFGSAGEASAGHVYGATLALDTGISVLHVPFRGSMDAVNALVAGEIDFIIDGAVTPMAKAGRVVPLATIYRQRHPELPNVPTLAETGVRVTIPAGSGWGLLAPKGTPKDVLARLSAALRTALQHKGIQEVFVRANAFASWQAPDEFRASLAANQKMYSQLLPVIGVGGQ
ncbi:tripartite tricarboxylate transporter substrate binding protein [Verminephrobacter eiseniae]|nr:tripartite tricarboxylate transporter substrate binding protein [Verminephrobacter eiseniae]MCW5293075.1 tripartite tricarboxylate transporter substrate binding protein [Verminephrobacter eiseniae]MCW8186354.1 tripartite tricarboxylate transporter substrate binding protein [Verminephrobacter eiseniae]MCW8221408.1 tripartite tricarboxylate transporter substrate binding protein [Verminephrobacter eiseniae]MCW8232421.1 tripartite tricarboxylate transporter substrate binding protein [Verminephro